MTNATTNDQPKLIETNYGFAVSCKEHGEAHNHYVVRSGSHISNTTLLVTTDRVYADNLLASHLRAFHGAV